VLGGIAIYEAVKTGAKHVASPFIAPTPVVANNGAIVPKANVRWYNRQIEQGNIPSRITSGPRVTLVEDTSKVDTRTLEERYPKALIGGNARRLQSDSVPFSATRAKPSIVLTDEQVEAQAQAMAEAKRDAAWDRFLAKKADEQQAEIEARAEAIYKEGVENTADLAEHLVDEADKAEKASKKGKGKAASA
jgi:hypothetical protein